MLRCLNRLGGAALAGLAAILAVPAPARSPVQADDGAPMSPVGVTEARRFGPLELWIPVRWSWSEHSRWPHRFAAAVPAEGGALVQAVVLDIPAEAAGAAFAAQAEAAAAELLGGSGRIEPRPGTGDFPFAAEGRGTMLWGSLGPQATRVELKGAITGTGFAMVLAAWAEDAAPLAADASMQVMADLALAAPAGAGAPAGPVEPPPPSPPGSPAPDGTTGEPDVLFAGDLGAAWLPVSVAGGDFAAFATAAPGRLAVDVPAGHGWGKTGVRSIDPIFGREAAAGRTEALSFRFDPAATDAFVLALADRDGDDEWGTQLFRFAWSPLPEGGSVALLFVRQAEVWRMPVAVRAPDRIDLVLDPSGSAAILLPDGRRMEAALPALPPEGFRIHAIAHPANAEQPARMALTRIERLPPPDPAPAVAPWPDAQETAVLFDGRLGGLWAAHALWGGDVGRDARLDGRELEVVVPPGRASATAGLFSREPVIWLERLEPDGAVTLEARLNPARTGSFLIALTRPLSNWDPASPGVMVVWREGAEAANGTGEVHLLPDGLWHAVETGPTSPDRIALTIRPGEVEVAGLGPEPLTVPWAEAAEGAGLYLVTFPFAREPDAGARLALRSITLSRRPAAPMPAPAPAPGVEPLPIATVFAGAPDPAWLPAAVAGGNFEAFARYEQGMLVVEVPPGNSWAKTGLLSAEPLVRLDPRAELTPTRIEVQLDPARMQTFNLALSNTPSPEMWFDHALSVTLRPEPARRAWTLTLHGTNSLTWTREIDPAWMASAWDGRLWIDIGQGWNAVELPGGPRIRGGNPTWIGQALYATILAQAPAEHEAAALALRSVRVGLVTPPGLSAVERWRSVDDAEFDPDAFLSDLAAEGAAP